MLLLAMLPETVLSKVSDETLCLAALSLSADDKPERASAITEEVLARNNFLAAYCLILGLSSTSSQWTCATVLQFVSERDCSEVILGLRPCITPQQAQQLLLQALGPCSPPPWRWRPEDITIQEDSWVRLWQLVCDTNVDLTPEDVVQLSAFDYLVNHELFSDQKGNPTFGIVGRQSYRASAVAQLRKREFSRSVTALKSESWYSRVGRQRVEQYQCSASEAEVVRKLSDAQWLMLAQRLPFIDTFLDVPVLLEGISAV